jgi:hypothetical protein
MVQTAALECESREELAQSSLAQEQEMQEGSQSDAIIYQVRMESVVRMSKLPVVEETLKMTSDMYKKVKVSLSSMNFCFRH